VSREWLQRRGKAQYLTTRDHNLVIRKGNDTMTDATPAPAAPLSEADDKLWASLAHLGGILYILPSLIIYLVLKDRGAKVRVEAKEALNWQITFLGGWIILQILVAIISGIIVGISIAAGNYYGGGLVGILWVIPFALWVLNVIFSIVGFTKVNAGGSYRYPFALRLVK
jgi:uncharacterized protein